MASFMESNACCPVTFITLRDFLAILGREPTAFLIGKFSGVNPVTYLTKVIHLDH